MLRAVHLTVLSIAVLVLVSGCISEQPKESVKIGAVIGLTGPAASQGAYGAEAAQLAEEDINAAGGINGRPVRIIVEDSETSPAKGVTAFQKLASENVVAVVSTLSSVSVPLSYEAEKARIPLIMAVVTAKNATRGNSYAFRYYLTAEKEVPAMAAYLRGKGKATAAVLSINDEYGASSSEEFDKAFAATGGQVVAVEKFAPADADYRTQLAKIKEKTPDAVYIIGFDQHIPTIFRQAKELGLNATFATTSALTTPATQQSTQPYADVVYVTGGAYNLPGNEKAADFRERYKEKFGREPAAYSAYFYDAFMIIRDAAEKGTDEEPLRKTIENTKYVGLLGNFTFLPNHDADLDVFVFRLRNATLESAE